MEVEWHDGSTCWLPLKTLEETDPIQVADYAKANWIDMELAFVQCSLASITVQFEHVKGHQDVSCSASSLLCFTQLNILADQLAKQALLCLLQHCQH